MESNSQILNPLSQKRGFKICELLPYIWGPPHGSHIYGRSLTPPSGRDAGAARPSPKGGGKRPPHGAGPVRGAGDP